MPRILFEKTGNAIWMSHLDTMRLFQRMFQRAKLPLKHTQGFNPRPTVSIALPLSVGVESKCELLDFELEGEDLALQEICDRLNAVSVDGLPVLRVYEGGGKIRDLSLLDCTVTMEYDNGVPSNAVEAIEALFQRKSLILDKKGKNGIVQQDIVPMIRRIRVDKKDPNTLCLNALICCQNPTLNPAQLAAAIGKYLPQFAPDFFKCRRNEIYDSAETIFR